MTVEKTIGSPSENTQRSSKNRTPNEVQEECDERNVNALLKTPHATFNVFGTFDSVTKKGWPHIPRIWLEEDAIEKANSNNITNEICGRELFKLFLQSPQHIKTNFF
jgi:hypothetical protein